MEPHHQRELLERLTLREKIAQMTQIEKNSTTPEEVRELGLGSVLSGGGGNPEPNTAAAWRSMVHAFAEAARESRHGIPLLYGSDAVHGHNNLYGATIFPHPIGLGAIDDAGLMTRIGRATALEMRATGANWSFAPALSLPLDLRWGRSYEGYGQDPALISRLASALIEGYRGEAWTAADALLPCAKHYLADGAAIYGSSRRVDPENLHAALRDPALLAAGPPEELLQRLQQGAWSTDQGDAKLSEAGWRELFLPPYQAALKAGALTVMASFSSLDGVPMHAHRTLLSEVLKGELGFEGFVVSDWGGIDQLGNDRAQAVAQAINAGVDMAMVPYEARGFIDAVEAQVAKGAIELARIDDAVARILRVKARLGLFAPAAKPPALEHIGAPEHRRLAAEAAARSAVLLQHRGGLPLAALGEAILVAGAAADDIGLQCGGWTIDWIGAAGAITPGSTLLEGLRVLLPNREVLFEPHAAGERRARTGVAVIAEQPYAEGFGDRHSLQVDPAEIEMVLRLRDRVDRLVVVLFSGRPLVLGPLREVADAIVAAWLPGSEGGAVAEVLCGVRPFEATLRFRWPERDADLPLHPFATIDPAAAARPAAFEIGHGLRLD